MHVVATPVRHPWRAATNAGRVTRWLRDDPGVEFSLCGRTSAGAGHRDISRTLSFTRVVALVEWTNREAAADGRRSLDARCRDDGAQVWSATLRPLRAQGEWDGRSPFRPGAPAEADGLPVASLTCARVRPRRMVDFYLRSFPALARQACDPDSAMVAGLGFGGRVPLRDACTFSIWPATADVQSFAFGRSAHGAVQRRSVEEDWMSQSLFARFAVVDHSGTWAGADPLASSRSLSAR